MSLISHPGRVLAPGVLISFLLVMASASFASAAPDPKCEDDYVPPEIREDAMALTLQGIACFEVTYYSRALIFYRRAYAISPSPLLEAAIGRSLHELGLWGAAHAYYRRYLRRAEDDPDGRAKIEERLTELERQLEEEAANVTITSTPDGARVLLIDNNGHTEDMGTTPLTTRMAPGKYTIEVEKLGYYSRQKEIILSRKEQDELDVELVPQGATFNLESRRIRRIGTTTMLVSAPIAVAGGLLSFTGDPERRPFGYGMVFVGSLGLISGGIVTAIGHKRDGSPSIAPVETGKSTKQKKKAQFQPLVSPGFVGLGMGFRW